MKKSAEYIKAHGIQCDLLKLGSDGIQSVELEQTKAAVLHVTPFHSFPSGITASTSKRMEYLRWAEKHGGFIVEDNYDAELTVSRKNEDTLFSPFSKWICDLSEYIHQDNRSLHPCGLHGTARTVIGGF